MTAAPFHRSGFRGTPGSILNSRQIIRSTRPKPLMKLSKFIQFSKTVLTATLLLAPLAASVSAADKIVVGFSQIGAESAWRTANTQSIKDEAAKRGIQLVFSDAQQKQENQIKALRSFVAQGVDVI